MLPQSSRVPRSSRVGGKDDLGAIGSRKIGGKGLGNWYSLDNEIRMGKQYAEVVESTVTLLRDPVINEYVNRVGQNLVHNSDRQPLHFTPSANICGNVFRARKRV